MRVLICSDGTDPADKPVRLGGLLAGPCRAETTLLGIAERSEDEGLLRAALEGEVEKLSRLRCRARACFAHWRTDSRDPAPNHRIAVRSHHHWRGAQRNHRPLLAREKSYEVIKAIPSPVLLATGSCETLKSFVVCTGGKTYIDAAVQLTGKVAAAVGASVTLLHIMAEPPAIYADLVRLEEDVDQLLQSGSELGRNLLAQKKSLEDMGVATEVRVRHGIVLSQVFAEVNERKHDLIVTGTSQTRGPLGHYIMGDLTRSIVNRANVPVLVARAGTSSRGTRPGFWPWLKRIFRL